MIDRDEILRHPPAIMLPGEACTFLRLDVDREPEAAIKALNRLVDAKLIKPVKIGRCRRYSHRELLRFVEDNSREAGT